VIQFLFNAMADKGVWESQHDKQETSATDSSIPPFYNEETEAGVVLVSSSQFLFIARAGSWTL
jgi:hypothetical protein